MPHPPIPEGSPRFVRRKTGAMFVCDGRKFIIDRLTGTRRQDCANAAECHFRAKADSAPPTYVDFTFRAKADSAPPTYVDFTCSHNPDLRNANAWRTWGDEEANP